MAFERVGAPSDAVLLDVVRGSGAHAVAITRRGEDVEVRLADGRALTLCFTSQREVETWRGLLAPAAVGPRLFGAGEGWLLLERAAAHELGERAAPVSWDLAVTWLGSLHARFAGREEHLRGVNPHLLQIGRSWFAVWSGRAVATLSSSADPRARRLLHALEHYERVLRGLATLPATLIHADLAPARVRVDARRGRAWAVDWGSAAIGPGLLDLATLTDDCDDALRSRLLQRYRHACSLRVTAADLERCRLHLALQSIALDHAPRARDRIGEALALTERLEL